ncbi:MAG: tail fiber domain-containing protein [Saprospiraceae bacterium]|nr:tail fiber domain-containing protein [Saprospiraceae bacterium]
MHNFKNIGLLIIIVLVGIINTDAQNVGIGTTDPRAKLDVDGDLALRSITDTILVGVDYAYDVNTIKSSNYKLVGFNANFALGGITPGVEGRQITLRNATSFSMELYNEQLVADEEKRISTGINNTLAIYPGGSVNLVYDSTVQRWVVMAAHNYNLNYYGSTDSWGLNGNLGTTSDNYIGTNDEQALQFRVNNVKSGIIDSVKANTAFGYSSFKNNTTGSGNTAAGASALRSNTDGYSNVALGINALYNSTTQKNLVAIGDSALFNNGVGAALYFEGSANTAIGSKALYSNNTGFRNTANGFESLYNNTAGGWNTADGYQSLYTNTSGFQNTAIGAQALYLNTTGTNNTATGMRALYSNTSGAFNTSNGVNALYANTTGGENAATGAFSLYTNTTGSSNTASGAYSLYSNTTGGGNTAGGRAALYSNTTGNYNTAYGLGCMASNTTGIDNTAIGYDALSINSTGVNNTASGCQALFYNTTGFSNTANGWQSLFSNTFGSHNTAIGLRAMYSNIGGLNNTAIGSGSLSSNTTGNYNTASGIVALSTNTTGHGNTAYGADALSFSNSTGSFNIGVGYSSGLYNIATDDNQIAIGISTGTGGANKAIIGNSSQWWIGGQVDWSAISDARIKEQVQADVPGLSFIKELRPVTYHLNIHKQKEIMDRLLGDKVKTDTLPDWEGKYDIEKIKMTGFLAQEVEAAAKKINYDFSGVDVPKVDGGLYSLRYAEFVVPLVKAVQEQQIMIEQLKLQNDILLKRIEKLENK